MGKIYQYNDNDKALILGVRESLLLPFVSPSWTDLRLLYALSLTTAANDNTLPSAESLTYVSPADTFWLGLKNNNASLPLSVGTSFAGLRQAGSSQDLRIFSSSVIDTTLVTTAGVTEDAATVNTGGGGNPAFPNSAAAGYAAFGMVRVRRSSPTSLNLIASIYDLSDVTNTPTAAYLRSQARAVSIANAETAASAVTRIPTAIFIHWPFYNARLRIHALVLEKFA